MAYEGYRLSGPARSRALFITLGALAVYSLTATRHLPLFGMAVLVIAGPWIGRGWDRLFPPGERRRAAGSGPLGAPPILAGTLLIALATLVPIERNVTCVQTSDRNFTYPVGAAALLKASGINGNLATHFNWGQYIIWHLGPDVKVSMDGLRETVYPDDIYRQNMRFMAGIGRWDELLTAHNTEMALVETYGPAYNLMAQRPGWSLAFQDSRADLFAPTGSPQLAALRRAVPIPIDMGCFR